MVVVIITISSSSSSTEQRRREVKIIKKINHFIRMVRAPILLEDLMLFDLGSFQQLVHTSNTCSSPVSSCPPRRSVNVCVLSLGFAKH